ncbi:MAG: hypothetical protein M1825_004544 [Sarcosagium campestre]|nr:MAG: hypothetical protein M1825_004544 [Sarcosagium campestre]
MGLRITTWNVNGIRNPFGFQPWRDKRTFEGMFDILEADIVVMQEVKIQRKDLCDDMVLVPGWDCYFSLPKYKKGYSGVAIYTRQAVCAPVRAEEGITGFLPSPNSSLSYRELPTDKQIGGYPSMAQLSRSPTDPATLDSEGRAVLLEFPAFVLVGVYCPANRDESRDDFRLGFLDALDARVRNLVRDGKRVFLTGDLNISREEIDTANAEEQMRKRGLSPDEFVATPSRRLFNQLLLDGKVYGERDADRETAVLWDICRGFHPDRRGMFTCWEQKINARPGNFGSRIDYVLCSADMKDWFEDSNIQEGLMGSDHCPVYAVIKAKVPIGSDDTDILDAMNPCGVFDRGTRVRKYSSQDILALSGRLLPEFDRRRTIRDMFKASPKRTPSTQPPLPAATANTALSHTSVAGTKRSRSVEGPTQPLKRSVSTVNTNPPSKGQQSLKGFFKPKITSDVDTNGKANLEQEASLQLDQESFLREKQDSQLKQEKQVLQEGASQKANAEIESPRRQQQLDGQDDDVLIDPIVSKESWTKLFSKKDPPRCESHNEPCISLLTKKAGVNCGRSFWMCARPLGPSGVKERGSQWRCPTFIWSSDWSNTAD